MPVIGGIGRLGRIGLGGISRGSGGGVSARTISGAMSAAAAQIAGTGTVTVTSTAALMSSSALMNGFLGTDISLSGALQVQAAILEAAGLASVSASGALQAQAAQIAATGGGDSIPAVTYDGIQGHLLHTSGPAGAADGTAFTVVWAGTFNSDGSAMSLCRVVAGAGTIVSLRRLADNTIEFKGFQSDASTAVFSNATTAVAASLGFLIILASCNGTTAHLEILHAAGTITGTNTPGSAGALDLAGSNWWFGQDGAADEFLDADTAFWWADDSAIDFTDTDNIEQFWDTTNDLLRDPSADGSNPVDGAFSPLVCHRNFAASHVVNAGTGGDADTAGTFTDGTSPGTYAGDFDAFSDPSDIASLEIWLKASVGTYTDAAKTTPATSDGDRIGAWADQSGNGHDFTQATDDNRPTLKTAIVNGKPVIRADITTFVKDLDGPDLSSVFTAAECFLIVKVVNDPAIGAPNAAGSLMWKFGTQAPTTDTNHLPYSDSNIYDDFGSTTRKSTGNPTASLSSAFRCYNVVSVSGEWTSFIDATQHYTTATNTVGFTATPLLFNGPAGHGFRGDVAELIIFNAKLSAGDKANVRSYITAEYGITF